jgi:arylsulfatase A-like enzyme/Flp pilus assembly protein TadD
MPRRARWVLAGTLLLAAGWFATRSTPPNVLLITLDTTRADRLGCYGYDAAQTPHLDALAARGALFERAFAPAPLTLPSHATMLTGLYPPEHGVRANGESALPADVATLGGILKQRGYDTGAFVAAFVLNRKFGLNSGFETFDDDLSDAAQQGVGTHAYRPGEQVVSAALRWLGTARRPFFCWVHLFDPHYPYLTHADRYGEQYLEQPYDAEIRYVDEQCERLLQFLENANLSDRTIVLVVGDHGEALGQHGERSHSMLLYNSTLHVPWIMSAPRVTRPGSRVAANVSLVDVLPTVLDCLDLPVPDGLSGRSLRPALAGRDIAARPIYAETDEPYRAGHWSGLRTILDGRWKYILTPRDELYDLSADFGELQNARDAQGEIAERLRGEVIDWERQMLQRDASRVRLSGGERQKLESLGYASGASRAAADGEALADVKDRLALYHQLDDAETLVEEERYAEAVPLLREILREDEGYFRAHSYLGMCLLRLKETDEAIGHLRRSVALEPGSASVQATLGAALLIAERYAEAVDPLEAALRLDETSPQAHYNLGLALERSGKPEDALAHYQRCLDLSPDFSAARERYNALLSP